MLRGEKLPTTKRYGSKIPFSKDREAPFTELETIDIPSVDKTGSAAIGWIAHSPYFCAIRKDTGIRGIRARIGNVQVGDESVFDRLFQEERFNRWCVGEIPITDPEVVPKRPARLFRSWTTHPEHREPAWCCHKDGGNSFPPIID